MKYPNDLTGLRFGRLTVLKKIGVTNQGKRGSRSIWLCKCDCGKEKSVIRNSLVCGGTRSCGCLETETKKQTHLKHGMSKSRLWRIWCGMRERCNNPNNNDYQYYGGQGISVCEEWANKETGFETFCNWSLNNGYSDKLIIDRINTNGNYTPTNCRWATRKEQSRNRNITIKIPLGEIAEIEGISYQQAYDKFVRNRKISE